MSAEDDMFNEEAKNVIKIHKKRLQLTTEEYKKRLDYENKLVKMRRMEQILTRAAPMGGIGGMAFGMLQNIGQAKMAGYQRLKELRGKEQTEILTKGEAKERDMLASNKRSNSLFEKLDTTFEKHFGGDSKWNKFFGGQGKTAAVGLGLGALGGGMALGKMIIDSSPMFQQMLKLLNFGIMMVLRPIGDFFGFLMRPILLMLLRKFIIPFYQTALPVLQEMGDYIGNVIAPVLERIIIGITGIGQLLLATSPIAMALGLSGKLFEEGYKNIETALTGTLDTNITTPEVRDAGTKISDKLGAVGETITAKFQRTAAALEALKDAPKTQAAQEASIEMAKRVDQWTVAMSKVLQTEGMMKLGTIRTEAEAGLRQGRFESVDDAMLWFSQQMYKGGINKMANGGIINEPVMGIGRSGQGYLIGESGAERVTPMSGGSSSPVIINVYGDVNEKTMDSFERKVLDVLNRSNSRRGL
jgi:hypothetical protein